jgi:hypothetical protein
MTYFRLSTILAFFLLILSHFGAISQVSEISVQITWTSWASDNSVEIYTPSGELILSVCDQANCKTTTVNSSYSATFNLGCYPDLTNYYLIAQDAFGDGWNGTGNSVEVTSGGASVITYNLTTGTTSGQQFFNVSGGGTCPSIDAGIESINGPSNGCELTSSETISIEIRNQGTTTATSIDVEYSLNGAAFVSAGTYTGSITTGNTDTYSFNVDVSTEGIYDYEIVLSYTGDGNALNDTSATLRIVNSLPHDFSTEGDYTMGFEASDDVSGWSTQNYNDDGGIWTLQGTTSPRTGSNAAIYNYSPTNAADDWMFTPCLSLESGEDYIIEFYYRVSSATFPESFDFHLNTGADNASVSSTLLSLSNITNTTYAQFLDTITAASTGSFYFAWEATSTANEFNLIIDDFSVSKLAALDAGVVSIDSPGDGCALTSSETIQVTVENFGTASISSFPLEYSVNGASFQSAGTYSGTIAAGTTGTHSFTGDLSALGANNLIVRTAMVGDGVTGNDAGSATIINTTANLNTSTLTMGFETIEDFSTWSIINNNGDTRIWELSTTTPNNGSQALRMRQSNNGTTNDDWAFTPCIFFETGETYVLNFSYRARNAGFNESFQVRLTDAVSVSATVNTLLFSNTNFNNTTYADQSIEFTVPSSGVYFIAFRSNSASGRRGMHVDDVSLSNKTIYWTGSSSTDWNDVSNWSSIVPTASNDAIIPSSPIGNVFPNISATSEVNNLTIEAGATINFASSSAALNVYGNYAGATTFDNGSMIFIGNSPQTITGANTFHYLEINNISGVTISSGSQNISHELRLESGTLSLNGNMLTIESSASGDARIAPVNAGSIDGDVTVQRYIDQGATNWRFLASPITDGDFEQWDDDIITSGFIGSDYPNFGFVSIYSYQESIPGLFDLGYVPLSNSTQPMNLGEGYIVWSGSSNGTTDPFTLEVTGTIHTGTFNFPLNYTNSGDSANDGWNLVGNPYACAIDWDSVGWTKTNIDSAIYVWNPDENQFASYVNGIGTFNGSRFIASGQSFWVHAFDAPALTATESVKTDAAALLLNAQFASEATPVIKLNLQLNNLKDEIVVRFKNGATAQMDRGMDALKMKSTSPQVPFMYSELNGEKYSINSLPFSGAAQIIPIATEVNVNGNYFVSTPEFRNFNSFSCVILEDLQTGEVYNLKGFEGASIYMTTADVQPRFQLTVYPFISNSVKNATCYNEKDGRAEFQNTQSGFLSDVYLKDQGQNTIDSILGTVNDSSVVFNNLDQGLYFFFSNTTPNFCPSIRDTFRVLAPAEVIASFQPTNTQNALELLFENLTTGAYSFEWNFGDGETSFESQPIHKYDSAGIFTVTLKASNKNGCENITTKTIKVEPAALDQTLGVTSSSITEPFIMIEHRTLDVYIPQNSTEPVNLKVYTIQGALLYERAMGTTNFASINLSHLASSVYLVKLYVGAQYSNHKIVLP